ncbi:MAG: hypothetical protein RL461_1733, partial [Planctomycetota bacterium]
MLGASLRRRPAERDGGSCPKETKRSAKNGSSEHRSDKHGTVASDPLRGFIPNRCGRPRRRSPIALATTQGRKALFLPARRRPTSCGGPFSSPRESDAPSVRPLAAAGPFLDHRRCSCGRRSLWGVGMPRSRETVVRLQPSLPLGRRHASFAQTVLACSETGASVTPRSLTAAARQLSSQAAELALRGMPRPLFRDGRMASTECHAVNQSATRRPQRPSGPALRGFGSREGGTNGAFGGGCRPRRATDESASEAGWSERVRAARARGSGRTRAEHALAIHLAPRMSRPRMPSVVSTWKL